MIIRKNWVTIWYYHVGMTSDVYVATKIPVIYYIVTLGPALAVSCDGKQIDL